MLLLFDLLLDLLGGFILVVLDGLNLDVENCFLGVVRKIKR